MLHEIVYVARHVTGYVDSAKISLDTITQIHHSYSDGGLLFAVNKLIKMYSLLASVDKLPL